MPILKDEVREYQTDSESNRISSASGEQSFSGRDACFFTGPNGAWGRYAGSQRQAAAANGPAVCIYGIPSEFPDAEIIRLLGKCVVLGERPLGFAFFELMEAPFTMAGYRLEQQ